MMIKTAIKCLIECISKELLRSNDIVEYLPKLTAHQTLQHRACSIVHNLINSLEIIRI